MSIQEQVQVWSHNFFAQLEQEYARRPLVRAVLAKVEGQVNKEIPVLVSQGIDALVAALIKLVDGELAKLESAADSLPELVAQIKALNVWLDAEIKRIGQEVQQ